MSGSYRLGTYRINTVDKHVHANDTVVQLTPRLMDLLCVLVDAEGAIVTKRELIHLVWKDTDVGDGAITFTVHKLREALKEHSELLETVPRVGYRMRGLEHEGTSPENRHLPDDIIGNPGVIASLGDSPRRFLYFLAVVVVAAGMFYVFNNSPITVARNSFALTFRQITNDGLQKQGPLVSDGNSIFFQEIPSGHEWKKIMRVPNQGGYVQPVNIPYEHVELLGRMRTERDLLVLTALREKRLLWRMPLSSEDEPVELLPLPARTVRSAVYRRSGVAAYALANRVEVVTDNGETWPWTVPGYCERLHWSHTDQSLRFSTSDYVNGTEEIWELDYEQKQLKRLSPLLSIPARERAGTWTPDGRAYVFAANSTGRYDLWISSEKERPVRLTNGPISWSEIGISSTQDKATLFALGEVVRGELVRFDLQRGGFSPFLNGISAYQLDFSRDGKWLAYIRYPDFSLWKCKADGSEQIQLTQSTMEAHFPQWSPNNVELTFMGRNRNRPWGVYRISASGGAVRPIPYQSTAGLGVPTWSADGRYIVFGDYPDRNNNSQQTAIHTVNISTGEISTIAGSEGLWNCRWSPDGQSVAALSRDSKFIMLWDEHKRLWRAVLKMGFIEGIAWSPTSQFLQFNGYPEELAAMAVYRFNCKTRSLTKVTQVSNLRRPHDAWYGIAPDESLLALRGASAPEVYAITLNN